MNDDCDDIDAALAVAFATPEPLPPPIRKSDVHASGACACRPMMAAASGRPDAQSNSTARCDRNCIGKSCRQAVC